jgi:alpha-mannosidase
MTGRHHHHHGAPRADEPRALAEQPVDGRQIQTEVAAISRRGFLGGALGAALAGLAVKLEQRTGLSLPYLQTFAKRIYLAPDDHTDYFWSADEASYQQAFLRMLDYYLDKVDQTLSSPSAFQSRWNCDGSFWVWEYEHHRTAQQFNRLMQRVSDGHIGVPLNALCVCLGGVPAEAILRGMYYPGQLERRFGVRFRVAYVMENTTRPYGLGALWVGSGVKYSWHGICDCDTVVPSAGDREHEAYWSLGPDGSRLLVKWNSMTSMGSIGPGGYAEARLPSSVVDYVSDDPGFQARYPYRVIGVFGQGWDDVETENQAIVDAAKDKTNADRQVIVSNERDFFEDFEATYAGAAGFPTMSCTFGNEWELYVATLAEVSARVKRALEKLRAAEALATLVNLQQRSFMNGRETARAQAWMNFGLYWEHNFGMVGRGGQVVTDRVNWQKRLATEMEAYVNTLHSDAIAALGGLISKSGTNPRFFAFNPLSWARTDIADFPYSSAGQVHVIDVSTGQEVPSQSVMVNAQSYLRILASDVPAVGYKIFEIRSGAGSTDFSAGAPTITNGNTLNSNRYSLVVGSNGAITSLIDKSRSNREFAKDFSGKRINDLGAASGAMTSTNIGVVSATLVATVNTSSPLKHVTRITLFRDSPRIEIHNTIAENFDTVQTWHFGFNLASPDVWHEEVGAIIRAKLTTNGGHYSDRTINSRYDWLTLNHFADMTGGNVGVTLSNADCYFMKLGNSVSGALDTLTSKIEVLAGGKVVNGNNGLPLQGGDTSFLQRFALQTHGAYDQVAAMQFALEHQNPFVTGAVTGGTAYPATTFSFLSISNPNVLLWALKLAEDGIGQGIVARVWNVSNAAASFTLTLPQDAIVRADELSHIETLLNNVAVNNGVFVASLAAQQMKTYAFQPLSFWATLDKHVFLPIVRKD